MRSLSGFPGFRGARAWALLAAFIAPALPLRAVGGTYTVTGTIKTPTGGNASANDVPVKYIRVVIRNSGLIFDTTKATVYTTANGTFSASFIDLLENPNIYANVEYVGTAIDGHLIKLTDDAATPSPLPVDTNIEGVIHNNVPAGTLALGVLRTTNTAANIISHLGDSLRFVRATYALWPMPDDLIVRARLTDGASFVDGNGAFMSIAHEDYDHPGAGNAAFGDIHHESFHWIAYRAYGNRFPPNPCNPPSHSADLESCEGFAMQEGSAQYYGTQSAASIGLADQKSGIPDNTVWRGSDGTGFNNNGEIVEGALERIWRLNADNPGQIRVLLADSPDSMKQFKDAYATREGTTSAKLLTFFNNGAANGIVYTRVKISTFTEGAPANASPAGTGNFKVIDNIAFLRGTVRPTFVSLTKPELRLALNSAVIDPDQKDLGYKPAVNGLTEATTTAAFTFLGAVAFASPLNFDTSAIADGDYDLLARARNAHTWLDTFAPSFGGDGTAAVDSNEKWLKSLHTWYSQEITPASDDKGKVIVDNTPPTATNFKPQ